MRLRKNMKRTAAAALALSMAVSTAAVPASAGYNIDMSDATKITGDVEIKQEADSTGKATITISVGGENKTKDFSDGKEDDKITITGDNTATKSAATTTAAADAAKDDTKAPETTVTENKDGTVIDYTGKLDAQPDQEVSRPDSQNDQNDPEADQKNQGDQADQNDPEADQKNQGDQADQSDPEADQKNQNDPEADQSGQNNQNKDSEDADAGIMTYEAPAPTTLTSAVAAVISKVVKIINNVAGAENALNITLDNATIKSDSKAAMKISGEGDVNIELNHSNVLTSGGHHAGLEKNDKDSSGRLTIRDDLRNDGTAKTDEEKKAEEDAVAAGETTGDAVKDVGSLTATGGSDGGAGIGGGAEGYYDTKDTSSIVINGGKITATGGEGAAGIGGGYWGDGGKVNKNDPDDRSQTITINGGNIKATGIGGGAFSNNWGRTGAVTITGGHIQSKAQYGAGIGGGWGGQLGGKGDVLITGGEIEAEGLRGAGIGGGGSDSNDSGNEGGVAKVKIRGKNTIITKAEGTFGAGIGGGGASNPEQHKYHYDGGSAEIEITDGATVKEAVGGNGGAGIGSGAGDGYQYYEVDPYKTYAHVTIKNATVEVAKSGSPSKSNTYGAGIGGGGTRGAYWNGENVITIINSVIGRFQLDQNGNREKDANGNYLLESGTGALGTHGSEGIGRGANESGELSKNYGKNDVIIDNSWVPDGDKMKQEFNHKWSDTETLPTCTEDGEKGRECSRCGMKETEKIPALGHDWGAWTVTTPATCTNEGVETRICNRDPSHVETRTIPATGHNWVDNGNGTHTCTNCGATEAFGALELRVVDAEGMNKSFTVSQNGTLRTYTGAYDTATLTGDLNTLRYLQDHGAQTIQFVTNGQTSSFDINDLLAQGSGSEVFYLTHRGTEEPTLLLVEADHSELVKD
ncbi:hypothetical protein WF834_10280 [Faecalibacterium sp. HTF-128]|uniref:Carbohydrate-binding domain-containing protein n=2 Tax=Faecalibacterium wellingii TaxID=2929491 RepID=A0AB35Y7G9_9FIRM